MPHEILFNLLDEIQNTEKIITRESKERKFEKKVREMGCCFNIYIVVFGFLSSTVVEGRW